MIYGIAVGEKNIALYGLSVMTLGLTFIAFLFDTFDIKKAIINDFCSFLIYMSILFVSFNAIFGLIVLVSTFILFYSQKIFNPTKVLHLNDILYYGNSCKK